MAEAAPTPVTTIAELFYQGLKYDLPDSLATKKAGAYLPISARELQEQVEWLALALNAHGLKKGDHVALLSENRPEWAITDYACAILGLPDVTIYATLLASQAAFILNNSRSRWIFCSTPAQLQKVLETWAELPDLEVAVVMNEAALPAPPSGKKIIPFQNLLAEGRALEAERPKVRQWAAERKPEDLLTIIYTSGTTADPKGAMLTHGNIVSNTLAAMTKLPLMRGDRCLSFLPLTHIFERLAGHYVMLYSGAAIYYAESVATVPQNLLEVRPTVLSSVPRIYEKIYEKVMTLVADSSPLKRLLFDWAMGVGKEVVPLLYLDQRPSGWLGYKFALARSLVLDKIRNQTGGRIKYAASGGAPLSPQIMEFFWIIGLRILEGYGLTETSPIITMTQFGKVCPGTVGLPLYETWGGKPFVKIAPDGEILCHGPNVMAGYWANPEATAEAIDHEGYFHTGDIGEFDGEGRLKITDRKKELIITSGGKKIAPQHIENALKSENYISQAVLIGDRRNFISAILVPNFNSLERWAGLNKVTYSNHRELVERPEVYAELMKGVERVNASLSSYERIKKIKILDHEMTVEGNQLTPSLKIKRRVVNEMYGGLIDSLYEEHKGETEAH